MIHNIKLFFSVASWALALPVVLLANQLAIPVLRVLQDAALISFASLLMVAMLGLRAQTLIVTIILFGLGFLLLPDIPSLGELREAGAFVLIFACLMPTLALVRATAMTMPSVWRTQKALGALSPEHSASGLQLASHMLGGVMNTGSFALVAASLPDDADERRRRVAAEAALRGMNSSVVWSPFFIGFAVAGAYLPSGFAIGAIGFGVITAILFYVITAACAAPATARFAFIQSLQPLRPVGLRLAVAIGSVVLVSAITGLTALYAVVLTMPILCLIQMVRRPNTGRAILSHFATLQKQSGDELLIISVSMIIAALAHNSQVLPELATMVFGGTLPVWQMIWVLPVFVWFGSIFGVHPVISSAPLLALFSPHLTVFDAMFIMQGHMIGWSTGTMSSIASLSVITVADQFGLRPAQLAFGRNLMASGGLAIGGGGLWALVYIILT